VDLLDRGGCVVGAGVTERGGSYRLKADGTEERVEFDLPDGSTMKMIEAMMALPQPKPFLMVSPKVYAALRKK
jgi:hypothetical protein